MTYINIFFEPQYVLLSSISCIYKSETLCSSLSYVEDNFFQPIFNIDDQNNKYVFASKDTQAVYLNPNL